METFYNSKKKTGPYVNREPACTSEDVYSITRNYIVSSSDGHHKGAVIFMLEKP